MAAWWAEERKASWTALSLFCVSVHTRDMTFCYKQAPVAHIAQPPTARSPTIPNPSSTAHVRLSLFVPALSPFNASSLLLSTGNCARTHAGPPPGLHRLPHCRPAIPRPPPRDAAGGHELLLLYLDSNHNGLSRSCIRH